MKAPKAPKPTAQELAGVARQTSMLDEETAQMEKRLKSQARGKLGSKSLLAKGGKKTSGASGKSMIGAGYKGTPYNDGGSGGSNASKSR